MSSQAPRERTRYWWKQPVCLMIVADKASEAARRATAELHASSRIPHDGRTIVREGEGVVREERLMFMPFAADRFTRAVKVIAAILTLVIPSLPTGAAPSPILEKAARGIENHRKGDATIRFVRKDGTPIAGLQVEAIQRTHDFAFGNLFRPRHYTNELYRARFLEIFNFIQLLEFNWGQYEPVEGEPKFAERRAFIDGWCRMNGLTRFYGHMLTWSYQQDEPRNGPVNPFWLFRYDRDTQFRLLQGRIQREVRAYHDIDILWDVVNEPIHCRR